MTKPKVKFLKVLNQQLNKFNIITKMNLGTLISTIITKENIYLFSDGRTVNLDNGEINNLHTKVHRLSKFCGLLVAGVYMPDLPSQVSTIASSNNLIYANQIADVVQKVISKIWEYLENNNPPDKIAASRAFAFICGYDNLFIPRLYYVDSQTTPKFTIKERFLFSEKTDLEIAAMSTGSGEFENPTQMLTDSILKLYKYNSVIENVFLDSFDSVKEELAKSYPKIGGNTFASKINKILGYTKIQ